MCRGAGEADWSLTSFLLKTIVLLFAPRMDSAMTSQIDYFYIAEWVLCCHFSMKVADALAY